MSMKIDKTKKNLKRKAPYANYKSTRISPYSKVSYANPGTINKIAVRLEHPTGAYYTSTTIGPVGAAFIFRLSDMPDNASYTSIYDAYRIDKITAYIHSVCQSSTPTVTPAFAPLCTAIDYDDATIPTSFTNLMESSTSKVHANNPSQVIVRSFIPEAVMASFQAGAAIDGRALKSRSWIDMASTGVNHYGFKLIIRQATSTNSFAYYINFKYDVSFKRTR